MSAQSVKEIEIRVLTPSFYSRFVHYAYTSEAFDRECIFTDEKNRTCWISRPELLGQLLSQAKSESSKDTLSRSRGYLNSLRWSLLKKLRCAPAAPAYNATPKCSEFRIDDIRAARFSELDAFVRNQQEYTYAGEYRRIVTKLYLAQRCCWGFPQVISLIDWVLRVLLCYQAAMQFSGSAPFTKSALPDQDWWSLLGGIAAHAACHAYGLLKGYH